MRIFALLYVVALSRAASLSVQTTVDVSTSVVQRYSSTCVCLLLLPSRHQDWLRALHAAKFFKSVSIHHVSISSGPTNTFTKLLHIRHVNPLYVINTDQTTKMILKQLSETGNMSKGKWLFFFDFVTSLEEFFADIYIPVDSEFIVARRSNGTDGRGLEVSLVEVYRLNPTHPLRINTVARWSCRDGLTWTQVSLFERRKDFQGISLKSAVSHSPPYVHYQKQTGRSPVHVSGYSMQFFEIFQQKLNFTLEPLLLEDGSHGSQNTTGMLDGIRGMVASRRAEVGLNPMTWTISRLDTVDYLHPIARNRVTVFIKEPDISYSAPKQIVSPFSTRLWQTVGLTVLIISVLLSALSYNNTETVNYRIYSSIFYVFYILCQQSASISPRSWTFRVIHLTTHMTFMVLFIAYSATFISYLTVRSSKLPFTDFQGLLDDGTYTLGVAYNNAYEDYLKNSKDPIIRQVYSALVQPRRDQLPRISVVGFRRLCHDTKYSFFGSEVGARVLLQNASCNVIDIQDMSYRVHTSFIFNKQSPYKKFFNHLLIDFRSTGIIKRIDHAFWPPVLEGKTIEHHTPVTFDMLRTVYVTWAVGVTVSVLILCCERQIRLRT